MIFDLPTYGKDIAKSLNWQVHDQTDKAIAHLCRNPGVIFTAGNGGSSSTASHFTQDLMKACRQKSFCMSDNGAFILAVANDIVFDVVYSSYLHVNAKAGDTLVVISGSGNSENLVKASQQAYVMGIKTIALVGMTGGKLKDTCDIVIHVPLADMRMVESAHGIILHYIIASLAGGS